MSGPTAYIDGGGGRGGGAHAATTMRVLCAGNPVGNFHRGQRINYILYTTVPPSREPLVWVVDIGFDICTSRSSAIFIARIKRQTSFTELLDFYIILVANIVPSKNLKLQSRPIKLGHLPLLVQYFYKFNKGTRKH